MANGSKTLFAPSTILLLVTGFFHLGRGATADGLAFLIGASALIIDARLDRAPIPLSNQPAWRWWREGHEAISWVMIAALAVAVGTILGVLTRYSLAAEVIVVVVGAPVFFCAWMDSARPLREDDAPPNLRCTASVWLGVGIAICVWELTAFLIDQVSHRYFRFPTMSNLLNPLMDNTAFRAFFAVVWVFVGVAMIKFRRTRR
ncbi:MAG TPA: hypothetical protein VFG73_09375 [Rhodanobacteraceae bacterium]|nr:hypothetical protein [Rhodanobacteraceae bacterium]